LPTGILYREKRSQKHIHLCSSLAGRKRPTVEFSDPLKANLTPKQQDEHLLQSSPKRKAPKSREEPVTNQKTVIKEQSDEFLKFIPTDDRELLECSTNYAINESTTFDKDQVMCDVTHKHVYEDLSGKLFSDPESHTIYSKYELSTKVETMILKNKVSTSKLLPPKIVSILSYENIVRDAVPTEVKLGNNLLVTLHFL